MKVLVVGAMGFLGKAIVSECSRLGWEVTQVVRDKSQYNNLQLRQLEEVKHDTFDCVFNVAAFIPYGHYNTPDPRFVVSNIELPVLLNRYFPGAKMIFASSVSVYGHNSVNVTEESAFDAPTLYGLSKLSGETVTAMQPRHTILRFSSLYGPGMNNSTFIPKVIRSAEQTKHINVFGDGSRQQNYLHVADAAKYCIAAAVQEVSGALLGVFPVSFSNLQVAECIAGLVPGTEIVFQGEDKSPSFIYDNRKTMEQLKFRPELDIYKGIKSMINE